MARRTADPRQLEARIGHVFRDPSLLQRALTHVSAAGDARRTDSYQRLEFLGDRVLGLAIADLLYESFPKAPEGELSPRLADLVRRETCAEVAADWGVPAHVRLGAGEAKVGGRRNRAILADICESIIGAVFLDAGYEVAKALVERSFAARLEGALGPARDPKTILQEWAQGRGLPTPTYELLGRTGPDHAPTFRIAAKVDGLEDGVGTGASKRIAEQAAASALLEREGVIGDTGSASLV